jgi:hypothetical protein
MKKIIFSLAATAMFSVSALANPTTPSNKELQKDNSKTITVSTTSNGDEYESKRRKFWGRGEDEYMDDCHPTSVGGASQNANHISVCECTVHYTYCVFGIGFEQTETQTVEGAC